MQTQNKYQNKLFSILGDSISTLSGYSIPDYATYYDISRGLYAQVITPDDTWWGQVINRLGGELLVNNSFSGSTVCWDSRYEIQSYGCSDERTSGLDDNGKMPDVIMIFIGINDFGKGTKITAEKDGSEDLSVFSVAYAKMLEQLRYNYPNAELWCFTFPLSTCKSRENFVFPYCRGGIHIEQYCDAIRDAIRKCALQNKCRIIDLYASNVTYDTVDGFHPNAEGMKTIADAVLEQL